MPKQIRSMLQGRDRDSVFQQAMKAYLNDPGACAQSGNRVLNDLIYGWGNEAWSVKDEYLADCIKHALTTAGPILECGTGLSTVLLGVVAKHQNLSHLAFEHKPEWAAKVQRYLMAYNLDSVIQVNPLKNYGDFCWYDISSDKGTDSFSLVVCDGPPSRTKGGRYGLAPIMGERLKSSCIILLDDGGRKAELKIAKRWETELNATVMVQGTSKPYIKISVA